MKEREEGIKRNIMENQKEKEFRKRIIESHYDLNNSNDQKFP